MQKKLKYSREWEREKEASHFTKLQHRKLWKWIYTNSWTVSHIYNGKYRQLMSFRRSKRNIYQMNCVLLCARVCSASKMKCKFSSVRTVLEERANQFRKWLYLPQIYNLCSKSYLCECVWVWTSYKINLFCVSSSEPQTQTHDALALSGNGKQQTKLRKLLKRISKEKKKHFVMEWTEQKVFIYLFTEPG